MRRADLTRVNPSAAPQPRATFRRGAIIVGRCNWPDFGGWLRLEDGRVDVVCVEALVDHVGRGREIRHSPTRNRHMRRGKGLVLVEPPDVELVDGIDTYDLHLRISLVLVFSQGVAYLLHVVLQVVNYKLFRRAF